MRMEVPISKDSEDYIMRVLKDYNSVDDRIQQIEGRCLIHLYPKEDTMINGKDELHGYIDAMLCEMYVYDTKRMEKYYYGWVDQVDSEVPCRVRVFKDLSTMLIFDKPIDILYGSSTTVTKKGEYGFYNR